MTVSRWPVLSSVLPAVFAGVFSGALALIAPATASAQDYPARPIKLVVPFAPGGATDILGRLLASSMSEKLGQPIVVENRPGGGTTLAASQVAKAQPDGYTLLMGGSSALTLNPAIRPTLSYDPLRSFTLLGLVAELGHVLVVSNDVSGTRLQEIVAQVKAAPDKFSYGSFGIGTSAHFGAEMIKSTTGIKMVHIPYSGSGPSLTALMGGQNQIAIDTVVAAAPLIKAGKIKGIAALGSQRLALLPQLPTVAESGYPGFDMAGWFALLAPAGLPLPVQKTLEKALADVMASSEVKNKLLEVGLTPAWGSSAALRARIDRELPLVRAVAARADIRID